MQCAACFRARMRGAEAECDGFKKRKLKKKIKKLKRKGYVCEPGAIYGYRANFRGMYGKWYTSHQEAAELANVETGAPEEGLDAESERIVNLRYLCEK